MPKLPKDFLAHNFEGSSFVWREFKNSRGLSLLGAPLAVIDAALLPLKAWTSLKKTDSDNEKELERLRKDQGWPKSADKNDGLFSDYYAWQQQRASGSSQSQQGSRRSDNGYDEHSRNVVDPRSGHGHGRGRGQGGSTSRPSGSRASPTRIASNPRRTTRRQRDRDPEPPRTPASRGPRSNRETLPPTQDWPRPERRRTASAPTPAEPNQRITPVPQRIDQAPGVDPELFKHPRVGPPHVAASRATQATQSTRYTSLEHDGNSSIWGPGQSEVMVNHPRYKPTGRADSVAPGDSHSQVGHRAVSSHHSGSTHSARSSRTGRGRPGAAGQLPVVREEGTQAGSSTVTPMMRLPGPIPPPRPPTISTIDSGYLPEDIQALAEAYQPVPHVVYQPPLAPTPLQGTLQVLDIYQPAPARSIVVSTACSCDDCLVEAQNNVPAAQMAATPVPTYGQGGAAGRSRAASTVCSCDDCLAEAQNAVPHAQILGAPPPNYGQGWAAGGSRAASTVCSCDDCLVDGQNDAQPVPAQYGNMQQAQGWRQPQQYWPAAAGAGQVQNPATPNGGYAGDGQYKPQPPEFMQQQQQQQYAQPMQNMQTPAQGMQNMQAVQAVMEPQFDQYGRPMQDMPVDPGQAQMQYMQPPPAQQQGYMQGQATGQPMFVQPAQQHH